jgi:hypothetical protein
MNLKLKKVLLISGGGLLLFWAFKKLRPYGGKEKSSKIKSGSIPTSDSEKKNAAIVIKAYSDASKAGESAQFLDEMNATFAKEYSLRVYKDKGTGKLFAADLSGNKIM